MLSEDFRTNITRGMDLLDNVRQDWRGLVDWDHLDMSDMSYGCILTQVFGSYSEGKDELDISWETGSDYGFDVPSGMASACNYGMLSDMWYAMAFSYE